MIFITNCSNRENIAFQEDGWSKPKKLFSCKLVKKDSKQQKSLTTYKITSYSKTAKEHATPKNM